jgi:SAM-dependent methyltransferase
MREYQPEAYWDRVAEDIGAREELNFLAGDDEPYYRHKRKLFLKLFDKIGFHNKKVLEVGSGPGGNLDFLSNKRCSEIVGVDVSDKMIELSRRILWNQPIRLQKIDGRSLPFDNDYLDLVFTSTVLQHNTDEQRLLQLVSNMCRVSKAQVIIFERIEQKISGHSTNQGRPVEYYGTMFRKNGFTLIKTEFLRIQVSYLLCGIIRKVFNKPHRREGQPVSKICYTLENIVLPITKIMDKLVSSKRDLAMLVFNKDVASSCQA